MEPPGGVRPDRDRQLVLRNQSAAPRARGRIRTSPGPGARAQPAAHRPRPSCPWCPASQPVESSAAAVLQTMQQLSPSAGGNNNAQ
ncbi:GM22916 [Drosophila sechellia]|uniref:GM22916 n=1 Tax=Drosophila sechellia TaxID=7238 RepID=B4I6X1_DROSE|nr:GM22916 [Drosophila sechellia]